MAWFLAFSVAAGLECASCRAVTRQVEQSGFISRRLSWVSRVICGLFAAIWALALPLCLPYVDGRLEMLVMCFVLLSPAFGVAVNAGSKQYFLIHQVPACLIPAVALMTGDMLDRTVGLTWLGLLAVGINIHQAVHGTVRDAFVFGGELHDSNLRLLEVNVVLEHRARHDQLTGLANRAVMTEMLEERLPAQPGDEAVAVLILDVDRFKAINDSLGHLAGDQLLREMAERLRDVVGPRGGRTAIRLGGDEFAVLIDQATWPAALVLGEQARTALSSVYHLDGRSVTASVSVGVAVSQPGDRPTDLVRYADTALYQAKAAGRDAVVAFDEAMRDTLRNRLGRESDLRRGLVAGEIVAWYQPEVSLLDHAILGAEALARWQHPALGVLAAGHFVPLAEETHLINLLSDAILSSAHQALIEVPADLGLRVNVAPPQLRDRRIVDRIAGLLAETGRAAHTLTAEITESALLGGDAATLAHIHELRALGVRVALDDFGTGYSSLSALATMPIDALKIDRSFVAEVTTKATHRAVVESVLLMGRRLGLDVVAEGIETTEQEAALRDLGCSRAQGFLYSRAVPLATLLGHLDGVPLGAAQAEPASQPAV
jgi:diguanylate cyclase (GGDEF)-like protein